MKHLLTFIALLFTALGTWSAGLAETQEAAHIPWSGYWWPYKGGGLATGNDYRGRPAPLDKYGMLQEGSSPQELIAWYKQLFYDPNSPDWYGLCNYWAKAAVYEQYPIYPSSENNIIFRVGDKKGLLTLAHSADREEQANASSSPLNFHIWLLNYIKDQQEPFVADLDAGPEVWSYPIFKYDMQLTQQGEQDLVRVTIWYATDFVSPDYMGSKIKTKQYTYTLERENGAYVGGTWTGASVDDHPEELWYSLEQGFDGPYLQYSEVARIARAKDDFLEADAPVTIQPGTYHLTLLNRDLYKIDCRQGDEFELKVIKEDGSAEDIQAVLTDNSGTTLQDTVIKESQDQFSWSVKAADPPYFMTITQANYLDDPNIYTLKLDLEKQYSYHIPYLPLSNAWSGLALTNPEDSAAENIIAVTYDEQGSPLQTVMGPYTMEQGKKRVFLFENLNYREHELTTTKGLTIYSDDPIHVVNLFADSTSMSAFVEPRHSSEKLILPDTLPTFPGSSWIPGQRLTGGLFNATFSAQPVTFNVYKADGSRTSAVDTTLPSRGRIAVNPGEEPLYDLPDRGWIEIEPSDGNATLYGFLYHANHAGKDKAESLFALSEHNKPAIIPLLASPPHWETDLILINTSSMVNTLTIHPTLAGSDKGHDVTVQLAPKEKRKIAIGEHFDLINLKGSSIYQSLLTVESDYSFAGYFAYDNANNRVELPLLSASDCRSELIFPHYARKEVWWNGISLFSPLQKTTEVIVEPYNKEGQRLTERAVSMVLYSETYKPFTISSLFTDDVLADLSFVKIRCLDTQDKVGGVYLYGRKRNDYLSGGIMQ